MTPSAHARLAPSGAHRWMTCIGSVAMEAGEPDTCNEYTDEGTAAHALAAMCLIEGSHPAAYLGRVLEVVNGVYWPGGDAPLPPLLFGRTEEIRREFEVDTDMVAGVNTYVQRIKEYAQGNQMFVEQRVPIDHITGEPGASGTADVVIITTDGELQAHDLKFGMGVKVFAEKNPQLMLYMLGAKKKYEHIGSINRFRAVIHQPRLSHLSEWDCEPVVLSTFAVQAKRIAVDVLRTVEHERIGAEFEHTLVPSDDACKFCKANGKCPALDKHVSEAVGAEFDVLADEQQAIDGGQASNLVQRLIPTDLKLLGTKLKCVELVEIWCKATRARVEAALFERSNSPEAITLLDHKLVEGRRGRRVWCNEKAIEAALKHMRLKKEEMFSFKLITPAAAEKFFKPTPKRWATVEEHIVQPDGKPSVAPANDNRPALVLKPTADDFEVIGKDTGEDLV